jgi:hypothetical protein
MLFHLVPAHWVISFLYSWSPLLLSCLTCCMTLQCPLPALCPFRPPVWPPPGYCAGAGCAAWLSAACCCLAAGPYLPPFHPHSDPCWRPCGGVRWCPHA